MVSEKTERELAESVERFMRSRENQSCSDSTNVSAKRTSGRAESANAKGRRKSASPQSSTLDPQTPEITPDESMVKAKRNCE